MNEEKLRFDLRYKREDWVEYLGEKFNYNVGVIPIEENIIEKYSDCLDNSSGDAIVWLGNLNIDEEIGVYEIKIKNTKLTTRVKISKICTDVIRTGVGKSFGKGIFFILYSNDSDKIGKYRISYVKYDKKVDENFDVEKDLSNPKRFTYLLGEGAKVKTATSRLTKDAFTTIKKIEEAFSVEPVNKEFYNGIKKLFDKIYRNVLNNFNDCENIAKEFSLRFLGRTLFCWFLREKDLIPKEIFDSPIFEELKGNYYEEVLEELFFNVLNAKMNERKIVGKIIKKYEKQIPFLNGGLFAKQKDDDKVKTIDNEIIKELFEFFSLYNFTVDESAPFDVEISIEPEMLGRIFENLLAEINPETSASARKETGSFYTPREIVDYMVCESIKLYLKKKVKVEEKKIENIFSIEDKTKWTKEESAEILKAIHEMKILDIACGSGAFPIGILQRVFMIIDKLDSNHEFYKELLLENIRGQAKIEFEKLYESKKFDYAYKLYILQNMIHGVDIQPIAIEISRLRAFLSLIVEEEKNEREDNLGIKPLPNLEFNFISANSLISLENKKSSQREFKDKSMDGFIEDMRNIAERYFIADSLEKKKRIKTDFEAFKYRLKNNSDDFLEEEDKKKFLSWNPFENKSAEFFDSELQFGIKSFDIVIGNPPYGAKIEEAQKKIFKENYKTAKTIKGVQKGSLDTYTLFIEKGFDLLGKNGNLTYIVPISFTSSDSLSGVHYLLENNCENIWVSSYAVRPQPVFQNAVVNTSIIAFEKTLTPCKNIFSTKMYRKGKNFNLSSLINNLQFIEVKDLKMFGRIPKISLPIEKSILHKIFKQKPIKDFLKDKGEKIYYRVVGGRYFKIVTNYSTHSNKETFFFVDKKYRDLIGCILSSSLSFYFYQVYSNNLSWTFSDISSFTIPFDNINSKIIKQIEVLYKEYLKDIEKNANVRAVSSKSKYTMDEFKEYKIGKSKHIIDKIDRLICPLYGLSEEEMEFIIGYELEFRV
ncbi:Eco57I restriction-modification methylase domain-containing protein [Brachyspira sp.]|uniref:Eco57I restriction-modification methylase domain-containing protein n=1 Tax=Brachyspira sp. TaxID=1977261 RepID=UPI003D7CD08E